MVSNYVIYDCSDIIGSMGTWLFHRYRRRFNTSSFSCCRGFGCSAVASGQEIINLFNFHDQECDIVAQFAVTDKFEDVFRDAFGNLGRVHMLVLMQLFDQAFTLQDFGQTGTGPKRPVFSRIVVIPQVEKALA